MEEEWRRMRGEEGWDRVGESGFGFGFGFGGGGVW